MSENANESVIKPPVKAQGKQAMSRFPEGMKFFRVMFTGRTDPNDLPYVPLAINGFELRLQRETEVILPDNFLKVADQASYDNYIASKDPRQPVIKDGIIRRFPFRIIQDERPAPVEKDFFDMLNKGNDITNAVIERNSTSQAS